MAKHSRAISLALILIGFCFFQAFQWASELYRQQAQAQGTVTLGLVVDAIDQAIGRFEPIPTLIASDPAFSILFDSENPDATSPFLNEKLRQIALSIEASEVYLMDRSGTTIATSNYRDDDSFLGSNFSYRPYFTEARAGEVSFFHALGTTSGERGFFFSAPVVDGVEILGVLAVKIPAETIEQDWQDLDREILISDENGIIFMTSHEVYKFRSLAPLSGPIRQAIADTQQFPLDQVQPLDLTADVVAQDIVRVTVALEGGERSFLSESEPLSLAGWHGIVFTPLETVQRQVIWTLALGGFACAAVILAGLVVWQRRANILQRIRFEQQQREMLEAKVQDRTADLNAANTNLKLEVTERRNAEDRLRKSQKELIQAGKLAALGQMSAAISHEINQPLGAIKSYAANASEFLARSRVEDAKSNVEDISLMTDRISEISHHLRNFARQPGDKLSAIDVVAVIDETIGIVGPQLRACNASIEFQRPMGGVEALGGRLRLQQVLVNIVNNALEAMSDEPEPVIEIWVEQGEETVIITARDHGPGLEQENMEHVFDAFYTTKSGGQGMGLGMSISQNIVNDFGGALGVANHPAQGAVFTIKLRRPGFEDMGEALP